MLFASSSILPETQRPTLRTRTPLYPLNTATLTPSPALSDYGPATLPDPSTLTKRRSTGASEALQYYWSSSAGGRSESISSSLGTLASPLETSTSHTVLSSPYSISPNPLLSDGKSLSQMSFQEVIVGGESPKGTRGLQLVAEPDSTDDLNTTMQASSTPSKLPTPPPAQASSQPPPSAYNARSASSTLTSTTSRRSLPMIPDAGITPHGAQNTSHPTHTMHSHHQPQRLPHLPSPSPSPQPAMTVDSGSDTIRSTSTRRKRPPLPPIPTSTPQTSSPASSYSSHSHRRLPSRPPSRPDSESGESQYSVDDSPAPVPPSLIRRDTAIQDELARLHSHRKGMVDMDGDIDVLLDPTFDEWAHQGGGNWNKALPDSAASTIAEKLVTPTQEVANERGDRPRVAVNTDLTEWGKTPSPRSADSGEKTPQGSTDMLAKPSKPSPVSSNSSSKGRLSVRPGGSAPGSDGPDSRRSTPSQSSSSSRNASGGRQEQPRRLSANQHEEPETPHSAPAHKTSFGDLRLPGRPASLLPAAKVDPPRRSQSLDKPEVLMSVKQQSSSPQQPPRRSPDPPPRSELRQPCVT